jgi:hypothetical protein
MRHPPHDGDARSDVVSCLVIAAIVVTMTIGPLDRLGVAGLGWIDWLGTIARAHADVVAIALVVTVLVVCFGSSDDRLSRAGRAALATAAVFSVLLVVSAVAATWTDATLPDTALASRLQLIEEPVSAAVIAGLAAWLAFRGVIIGDGDAGAVDGRSGAGAAGGADLSRE